MKTSIKWTQRKSLWLSIIWIVISLQRTIFDYYYCTRVCLRGRRLYHLQVRNYNSFNTQRGVKSIIPLNRQRWSPGHYLHIMDSEKISLTFNKRLALKSIGTIIYYYRYDHILLLLVLLYACSSWKMQFIHVSLTLKIYCSLYNYCIKNLKSSNGGRTT